MATKARKKKVGRPKGTPQSAKAKKLIAARLKAYWASPEGKKRKASMKKKGGVKKTTAAKTMKKTTKAKAAAPKASARKKTGKNYKVRYRTLTTKRKRGRPAVRRKSAPMG